MDKLISIITPNYNSGGSLNLIYDQLKLSQLNWEWLVIDDSSTDESFSNIKAYVLGDVRVKLLRNLKNRGAGSARQLGLDSASGSTVFFLDADDYWDEGKMEEQLAYHEKLNLDFSCTGYRVVKSGTTVSYRDVVAAPTKITKHAFLAKKYTHGTSTICVSAKAMKDVQFSNIRRGQDYVTWYRVLNTHDLFLLPICKTNYVLSQGSLSGNKLKKAYSTYLIYTKELRLNFFVGNFYYCFYALNGLRTWLRDFLKW